MYIRDTNLTYKLICPGPGIHENTQKSNLNR